MKKYNQGINMANATRFAKSPMVDVEYSRMVSTPTWLLPFNAGDIVPIYYAEVLPHDTFDIDLEFIVRQNTVLRPTMGSMQVDFYAFFVPNRIINESWKNVQGENTSGAWTAPEVNLAPLYTGTDPVQIPVGSVADYYGFPTQAPLAAEVLQQCNDLKLRGYLECFNVYFRSESYTPPVPYSKLNVYEGFMDPKGTYIDVDKKGSQTYTIPAGTVADGSFPAGAVVKEVYGEGGSPALPSYIGSRLTSWSALDPPLKAYKLHDAFTSVLPSPQKGPDVYFGIGSYADVVAGAYHDVDNIVFSKAGDRGSSYAAEISPLYLGEGSVEGTNTVRMLSALVNNESPPSLETLTPITGTNLVADLSSATGIPVNELRTAIATQHVYETLARGGSRYSEVLRSFFDIETETPFVDIPIQLGHIRRDLDLFQVAQTSGTNAQSETPQGTLTAFGYTNKGGKLFNRTFLEHGYVHVFAIVRQKNVYSTYFAPDNFRRSTLDFYLPQLANIGEQPVRLSYLNPFSPDVDKVIGYQEAWWEYRYEPDRVHGLFRTGLQGSLGDIWTYADDFDGNFTVVDGEWLKSNAQEVLDRTLAVTSAVAPQFKGMFMYRVDKQRPMPTYSVPGLDDI